MLAKLEAKGLAPTAPASRATLIRRLTFDLTGLPPTPEEIDAFVSDSSPDAYPRLVDRLLASPRYGERWGRHWLDVARFSESDGYERDKIRDNAWRYRDYVIDSFNRDKPYPKFIKEQIAGDVLEPSTPEGVIATGFLVAGPWDEVGSSQISKVMKARVREEEMEDLIGAVSQTFLGMTLNCARCHDHKFDPLPHRDYYRFKAAFDGVWHGDRPAATVKDIEARDDKAASISRRIEQLRSEVNSLEELARGAILARRGQSWNSNVPRPVARWTFDYNTWETVSGRDLTINGKVELSDGRLNIKNGTAIFKPLGKNIREKTLELWVAPESMEALKAEIRVMSIETSSEERVYDAIQYGKHGLRGWVAGSEADRRTQNLKPSDEPTPGRMLHIAIVYAADNAIAVYQDGKPYGPPYRPTPGETGDLQTYPGGETRIVFGGSFSGEIDEARLYDRALTGEQIAASYRAGAPSVTSDELVEAMHGEQRARRAQALEESSRQEQALKSVPTLPQTYAATLRKPGPTFVLARGEPENRGEEVTAGGISSVKTPNPEFGLTAASPEGLRRAKLAEWIASGDNPLTARVMVNRVWHYHFGRGIVGTPNDFGFNGDRPTHPELLDWLASEFVHQGWSVKALHRMIVLSNTYRQASPYREEPAKVDSESRLLWRFPPRRVEGEVIRDAMLSVSGQLNLKASGPGFRPFDILIDNSHFYIPKDPTEPEFNRRTVYRTNVNSGRGTFLESIDCPDPSVKTPVRAITTTPLQALSLMNNSFVLRQARLLAVRVKEEAGAGFEGQIERAYRLAFGRKPDAGEISHAVEVARQNGMESVCWALLNANEFLYVN